MQVQGQQVYGQERSGLDQSEQPQNPQTVALSHSATCWQRFPSVAMKVVPFEKTYPIYFAYFTAGL